MEYSEILVIFFFICMLFILSYKKTIKENKELLNRNSLLKDENYELRNTINKNITSSELEYCENKLSEISENYNELRKTNGQMINQYRNSISENQNLLDTIHEQRLTIEKLRRKTNTKANSNSAENSAFFSELVKYKNEYKTLCDTLEKEKKKKHDIDIKYTAIHKKYNKLERELEEIKKPLPPLIPKSNPDFSIWPAELHKQPSQIKKIQRMFTEDLKILQLENDTALIKGLSGKVYKTTLKSCTCDAFKFGHNSPCKHIYFLAQSVGAFDAEIIFSQTMKEKYKKMFDKLGNEAFQNCPWASQQIADLKYQCEMSISYYLKNKINPAKKASEQTAVLAKEKRELECQNKQLTYQLNFYETIFPWLEEFKEIKPSEAFELVSEKNIKNSDEYESLKTWISPQEYKELPKAQKYQLALDRYIKKPKTNWQIGIEFERYIGYKYEIQGYRVTYLGATLGLEDMGRDLLAQKGNTAFVIQCKRWAKEKTIHEKHIFQLYGTMVLLSLENPNINYIGKFVTTTQLSSKAKECAEYLKIQVDENTPISDYPLIKCNISKDGEKIYHLPFDQQYDRIVISPEKGEKYVYTVAESEKLGFRRAFKWKSNTVSTT